MKQDEREMLADLLADCRNPHGGEEWYPGAATVSIEDRTTPRQLVEGPWAARGVHYKRAHYLLGKWAGRGWYDYGVCLDLGWVTPEGWAEIRALGIEPRE